jgi:molybdate transport system substrate-binding protein
MNLKYVLLMLLLPLVGCRSAAPGGSATAVKPAVGGQSPAVAARFQGQVTIFAAASLTDAFKQAADELQRDHRGARLVFNFAGSPTLRTQLAQGARADGFASADEPTMEAAQQDGSIAARPVVFAQNRLVVVAPVSDPIAPQSLADLSKPGLKLVLAQQNVPVGAYARQALAKMSADPTFGSDFNARALRNLVSEETDVKAALAKVQLGEADAAVVYASDITPSVRGSVRTIDIPDRYNVIARYPIAVVKGAANGSGAQFFIDYLVSPAGQNVLKNWGFLPPSG